MKDLLEKYKAFLYCIVSLLTVVGITWAGSGHLAGTYATHEEVQAVSDESKCGDIVYRIDKILADIYEIENRYEDGQKMTVTDKKRYKKLKKRLKRWEGYEEKLNCEPEK